MKLDARGLETRYAYDALNRVTTITLDGGAMIVYTYTSLETSTTAFSLYFSNTFSLSDAVSLTVSGRYNDVNVTLEDQLGTALNGDHDFDRFNPAIGVTARLPGGLSVYAGYSESNRSPSPVELTCADEDDPCRLPNAFLADPPLEQVVAKTFEAGFRGNFGSAAWHAGVFRTANEDDIQFISAGSLTNQGFFDNVGETASKSTSSVRAPRCWTGSPTTLTSMPRSGKTCRSRVRTTRRRSMARCG